MARADLALAAVFPLASAFLTPLAAQIALRAMAYEDAVRLNMWSSLTMLCSHDKSALDCEVIVRHRALDLRRRLLRPVEVTSEAMRAAALLFVTATQFSSTRAYRTIGLRFSCFALTGKTLGRGLFLKMRRRRRRQW